MTPIPKTHRHPASVIDHPYFRASIMLRAITAMFLMTAFAVQTFNRVVIMLDYYGNKAAFARNCENKAFPKMHCNGKCQMMKRLKAEEKKDQQNPERKMENKNEVFSNDSFFAILQPHQPDPGKIFISGFIAPAPMHRGSAIFHPPCSL